MQFQSALLPGRHLEAPLAGLALSRRGCLDQRLPPPPAARPRQPWALLHRRRRSRPMTFPRLMNPRAGMPWQMLWQR